MPRLAPSAPPPSASPADLRRSIGLVSAIAIVVGSTIGSGIFRTPGSIAGFIHDPLIILGLWVFFGLVTVCGALTLAELAAMLPRTGGTYVYLRLAYGDAAAFVFGWLCLFAAIPTALAAAGVFFGELVLNLTGAPIETAGWGIPAIAIGLIVTLSAINIAGVPFGTAVNNLFTVVKVGALLVVIGGAWLVSDGSIAHCFAAADPAAVTDPAAAVRSVMFTYSGWGTISMVAGELRDAERRLKLIILTGVGIITLLYIGANLSYLYLIPLAAMPGTIVGVEAMLRIVGPIGGVIMTACILASIFGGQSAVILTKSRVAYAQARDGLSFAFLGRAHPTRATPHVSILVQGAGAIVMVLALREPGHPLRLFDRLTGYFVFIEWLALLAAIAAVFVLRRRMPHQPRPYRTPLYPFVPAFFIAGTLAGLVAVAWSAFRRGDYAPLVGLGIVAAGWPVFWMWRRLRESRATRAA